MQNLINNILGRINEAGAGLAADTQAMRQAGGWRDLPQDVKDRMLQRDLGMVMGATSAPTKIPNWIATRQLGNISRGIGNLEGDPIGAYQQLMDLAQKVGVKLDASKGLPKTSRQVLSEILTRVRK